MAFTDAEISAFRVTCREFQDPLAAPLLYQHNVTLSGLLTAKAS